MGVGASKNLVKPTIFKMPVPNQEHDICLPVVPFVDMVELPFGFDSVCGLALSFTPWSAVY